VLRGAPVEVIWISYGHLAEFRPRFGKLEQLRRFRIWKRSQQHGIDDAEDRGVCADAERERERRDRSKARIFCEHSESEL
jgi:hypothetical protein